MGEAHQPPINASASQMSPSARHRIPIYKIEGNPEGNRIPAVPPPPQKKKH